MIIGSPASDVTYGRAAPRASGTTLVSAAAGISQERNLGHGSTANAGIDIGT